jgi:membrane protease YdiL (CAAX protease family)
VLVVAVSAVLPGMSVALGVDHFLDFWRERVPEESFAEFERQVRDSGIDPALRMLLQAMVAGITINAIVALGQELGWRGFLHHELRMGFLQKSLVIGALWGVWHAPIVALGHNYPQHPALGIVLMVAWATAISPIFAYVRERSGSVVAAGILHGTLNALGGLPMIVTRGGDDLAMGFTGLAGFAAIAVALALIALHDRYVAAEPLFSRQSRARPG